MTKTKNSFLTKAILLSSKNIFSILASFAMILTTIAIMPIIAPIKASAALPPCSASITPTTTGLVNGNPTANYTFKSGTGLNIVTTGDIASGKPTYSASDVVTISRAGGSLTGSTKTTFNITNELDERRFGIQSISANESQKVEYFVNGVKTLIPAPSTTGTSPQLIGDVISQGTTSGGIVSQAGFEWKLPSNINKIEVTAQGTADDIVMYLSSPCNEIPVANNDTYSVNLNGLVYLSPLNGDFDPQDEKLTLFSINGVELQPNINQTIPVTNGTVTKEANGLIRFNPSAVGTSTFPYVIKDPFGGSATANQVITINPTSGVQNEPFVCDKFYALTNSGNASNVYNKVQVMKEDSTKGPILTTLLSSAQSISIDKNSGKLFYVTPANGTPAMTLFFYDPSNNTHVNTGQQFTVSPTNYSIPLNGGTSFKSMQNQIQTIGISQTGQGYAVDLTGKLHKFSTTAPYGITNTTTQILDNPNNTLLLSNMMISDMVVTNSGNLLLQAWTLGTSTGQKNTPYLFRVNDPITPQATIRGKIGTTSYDTPFAGFAFGDNNFFFTADTLGNLLKVDPKTLTTQSFKTDSIGVQSLTSCIYPPFTRKINATKTVENLTNPSSPIAKSNDVLEYTVKIRNTGDIVVGDTEMQDSVPNGTDYVPNSTTLNGAVKSDVSGIMPYIQSSQVNSPGQIPGSLLVDSTPNVDDYEAVVKFKVKIKSPIPSGVFNISNQAFLLSDSSTRGISDDPSKPGLDDPTITQLDLKTDLSIAKVVSNLTPNRGDTITYRLTAKNLGGVDAANVEVSDVIPAGLEFVAADTINGGYDPFSGKWFIGILKGGETRVLDVIVTVNDVTVKSNTAKISTSTIDTNQLNDSATATITPNIADLAITSTVDKVRPNVNDTVLFTVTIKNNGKDKANNIITLLTSPVNTQIVNTVISKGTVTPSGTADEWKIPNLAVGEEATVKYTTKINSGNKATATGKIIASDEFDNVNSNNDTTIEINPLQADLQLTKAVSNSSPNVGDTISWFVKIDNKGPDESKNIEIQENMPAGVEYVSHSLPSGFASTYTITGTNGSGVWKIPSLVSATVDLANSSKILRIVGKVVSPLKQTNNVEVTKIETFDPNLSNNKASATETPRRADVQLTKDVDNQFPGLNGNVIFKITVKNNGVDIATNLEVTDKLPAGLSYISNSTTAGTYNTATGIWSGISSLNVGASETLTLVAKVEGIGKLINVAEITRVDTFDDNPNNNKDDAIVEAQNSDLSIAKTVNNDKPDLYSTIEYTIIVTNNGPSIANDVVVTDILPTGLEFQSASSPTIPGATYDSISGKWSGLGNLANKGEIVLKYKVKVVGLLESITNQAKVTTSTADSNSNNNQDTVTITPIYSDLLAVKTVDKPKPFINEEVVYTIKVTNLGKDTATGIVGLDNLQTGVEFVSAQTTNGSYNLGSGQWNLSTSLKKGESAELFIRARITGAQKISNTITVKSNQVDPNPSNNTSTVDVDAVSNEISVKKTVNNNKPPFNSNVTYNVEVENTGEDAIPSLIVEDKLPTGVEFVSSNDVNFNQATGSWLITNLLPKTKRTLTIIAKVVSYQGKLTNCADAKVVPGDIVIANNKSCVDIQAEVTNLVVTKVAQSPAVNIGSNGKYTITVKNEGPDIAKNVIVTDPVPANAEFISSDTPGYSPITGLLNLGDMAPSTTKTIVLEFKILNRNFVVNTVYVKTDTVEYNYDDNRATSTITPIGADLIIDKTSSITSPKLFEEFTYTIKLKNDGPSVAKNTRVSEKLPQGVEYVSHTQSKGTWDQTTWSIGDMNNGEEVTLTIKAIMKSLSPVVNEVKATSDTFDQNTSNNTDKENNDPIYADLQIVKTVNNPTPAAGSEVEYTITFTNAGRSDAQDVTVEDLLPAGYTINSAATTKGTLSIDKKSVTIPTLRVGEVGVLKYRIQLPTNTSSVKNVVTIKSALTPDPNLVNNRSEVDVNPKAADLKIEKLVNNSTPNVNSNVEFTLNITNNGPSDTTNVEVLDVLSNDLQYVEAKFPFGLSSSVAGQTVKITIPSLANGQTIKIVIVAKVISFVPSITNEASVKSDLIDLNLSNNKSTVGINPKYTTLKLAKTVDNNKPQVGDEVTYTIKLDVSEQEATNVQVKETLPSSTLASFVSATTTTGAYNTATNTWNAGNLPVGSYTLAIKVKELSHLPNVNTVSVTTDTPQKNPETPKSVDVDPNGKPDAIDDNGKTKPTLPIIMGIVDGKLSTNPSPAVDNSVTDTDPDGDKLTLAEINGQPVVVGQVITLADGSKITILPNNQIKVDPVDPSKTDSIKFTYTISDGNGGKDTANVTVDLIPLEADLEANKTVNNAKPLVGTDVVFTLVTTNKGPDIALDVQTTDVLPANFKFVSASNPGYDVATNTMKWGNMANAESRIFTLTATALDEKPSVNIMKVTTKSIDKDLTNNTSEVPLDPNGKPDAIDDTGSTKPASPITMGIVDGKLSTNPNPAIDNSVKDTDPDGDNLTIKSINGQPVVPGVVITLPSGDKVVVNADLKTVTVTAKNNLSTDTIVFNYTVTDSKGGEDTATVTVTMIKPEADLGVKKLVSNASPKPGDIVKFTLQVTNNGPDTAYNTIVSDILPVELTYVSHTPSTYNFNNGVIIVGDLSPAQNLTIEILAKVNTNKPVKNVVTVKSDTFDPKLDNNRAEVDVDPDSADLTISKKVNKKFPRLNEIVEYTLNVKNAGPDTAIAVRVTETLPQGLEFQPSTASNYNPTTGEWIVGDMLANTEQTLVLKAKVVKIGAIKNSISVSTNTFDPTPNPPVDVTVEVNGDPKAKDDYGTTDPGKALAMKVVNGGNGAFTLTGLSDQSVADTDPDSDPLEIKEIDGKPVIVGQTITLIDGTKVTLTTVTELSVLPKDTTSVYPINFTYKVCDINPANADIATVHCGGYADAKVKVDMLDAKDDSYTAKYNETKTLDILANDPSTKGGVKIARINGNNVLTTPEIIVSGGKIVFTPTSVKFVPDGTQVNKVEFTYSIVDDSGNVADAKVVIDIANEAPIAKDDIAKTKPTDPIVMQLVKGGNGIKQPNGQVDNSVGDVDPEGQPLKITEINGSPINPGQEITLPSGDKVKLNLDGVSVTVTPKNPLDTDTIKFTYTIADPKGAKSTANATVEMIPLEADITLSKKVDKDKPQVGEIVEYTVGVKNAGPDVAYDVVVTDKLPDGLEYVSDNSTGTYQKSNGTWTIGDLKKGETKELKIKAKVLVSKTIINIANVTTSTPDPTPNPPVEVPIYPNDKPVAKDDYGITLPDMPIEMKLVDGGDSVANIKGQFDQSVQDTDPDNDPLVIVEIDGILVGADSTLTLANGAKVKVLSNRKTVLVTAANATTTKDFSFKYKVTDSRGGYAEANVRVKILVEPSPDIDVTKFNTPIKVMAMANDIATDPLITSFEGSKVTKPNMDGTMPKPVEVDLGPCKGKKGIALVICKIKYAIFGSLEVVSYAQASAPVITNIIKVTNGTATLNPDGSVTVTPDTGFTGQIVFTYEIKDSDGDVKETTVTITVPKPIADLDNTKTVNNPKPQVGEIVDFTLTVTNRGPDPAADVYVMDKLPAGLEYVSDNTGGKYDSATGKWTIGTLANAQTVTMVMKAKATSHLPVVNIATVFTSTQDPTPNPPKEVPLDPNGKPDAIDDLGATKPLQPIIMSIIEGGKGIQADKTIDNSVTDTDPDNDPLIITKLNGTAVVAGTVVKLDSNTTVTLNADLKTVTVLTTDPLRTNDIKFTYAISDSKGGSDEANVTVTLLPLAADLEIKKTILPLTNHMIDDVIEYSITVKNLGPDVASDIEVTDLLPSSLAFISTDDKNYDPKTGIVKLATLAYNASYTIKIKAKIIQVGTVENTATVKSKTPDPDPKNNRSTVTITPGKPTPRTGGEITYGLGIVVLATLTSFIVYRRTRKNKE
jgi:uncharacterized repeat protein (TIGR01451 family)